MIKKLLLILILATLAIGLLIQGEMSISLFRMNSDQWLILRDIRIPRLLLPFVSGGLLAICGLFIQTFFKNPIAGPDIMGISSAASLGLIVGLSFASSFSWMAWGMSAVFVMFYLAFLLFIFERIGSKNLILILGLLITVFISSFIQIWIQFSNSEKLKSLTLWTLGSFDKWAGSDAYCWIVVASIVLVLSFLFAKLLDGFFMGEDEAQLLGIDTKKGKMLILLFVSLGVSLVTIICGPITFLGIISSHVAKLIFKTSRHRTLIPATIISGAILAMLAQYVSFYEIPINACLGLVGVPIIVVFILTNQRKGWV